MQNLLQIEQSFLNLPQVKQALNLTEIRSMQKTITNGQKKKFEQTLNLSKLVVNAATWFTSEEGKSSCTDEGISWSNEEFGQKVFGWQKSFFYKMVKAGKIPDNTIALFNMQCTEIESEGKDANRSLEGLLKFAKQVETGSTASGQGEGEGEGDTEGEAAQVEVKPEIVLSVTAKVDDKKISVKMDSNGKIKTNNSMDEILEAYNMMYRLIEQYRDENNC